MNLLSQKKYDTYIEVDATAPGGQAIVIPGSEILAQRTFDDTIPHILVTVSRYPPSSHK